MDLLVETGAIFSPCRTYRYGLYREWDKNLPSILFLMLNPSIANEYDNDPTIQRCQKRAMKLGYGRLDVRNLFALVSTDPAALATHPDPVGPENDRHILEAAGAAKLVLCGWGKDGNILNRADIVSNMLLENGIDLWCLKITPKTRQPQHPLYIGYDQMPIIYRTSPGT